MGGQKRLDRVQTVKQRYKIEDVPIEDPAAFAQWDADRRQEACARLCAARSAAQTILRQVQSGKIKGSAVRAQVARDLLQAAEHCQCPAKIPS